LTATVISAVPDVVTPRRRDACRGFREEVVLVPAEMLTKEQDRAPQALPAAAAPTERDELRPAVVKGGSIMATSASKGARVAAGIVCAVFAAFVLIHLLWAVGVTWGLDEVSGDGVTDAGIALTAVSLAAAAAGAAAIIVTLGGVGWRKTRLSDRVLHVGAWIVFAWPAIGTLNPATPWRQRAVTLPLAIAALVVARAHPREAPRPPVTRAGRGSRERMRRMPVKGGGR
jgi:hypothetical protein